MKPGSKTEALRNQIRRKFLDDLYRKQRQNLDRQNTLNSPEITSAQVQQLIHSKNIDLLYETFLSMNKIIKVFSAQMCVNLLELLTTEENIRNVKGVHMLSIFVMHCCGKYQEQTDMRNAITDFLTTRKVCAMVLRLACQGIQYLDKKLIHMYLFFLKNCALVRIEAVRDPELLDQYLPILQKQLLSNFSVLVLLTFVGEEKKFTVQLIAQICNQGLALPPQQKLIIANILLNYVTLEDQSTNIQALFDHLIQIFQHLYMNCHKLSANISNYILSCVCTLIAKYPENQQQQLIERLKHSGIHNFLLLLLQISSIQTKLRVFKIFETIIQKCITNLRSEIFKYINNEILNKIMQGLEYEDWDILQCCIKMVLILIQYADRKIYEEMEERELLYIVQNLCYHKDQYISESAQILQKHLQTYRQQNSKEMCIQ